MDSIVEHYERNRARIIAAEDWARGYDGDSEGHAKLIRTEARLQRKLTLFYKELADKAAEIINTSMYMAQVRAYDIEVLVNEAPIDASDTTFISIVLEELTLATAIGAGSGEVIYNIPLGVSSFDAAIQQAARARVAELVGRKLTKDGQIVDNPSAKYRVSNKLRQDIRQSIATSLSLGETVQEATDRIRTTIRNPKRAELIAQTEVVNAYQEGLAIFADSSGAVGKEWQAVGAIDQCAQYDRMGPVPIGYVYNPLRNLLRPTAHPRCRCGMRLIYPVELENNADMQKRFRELSTVR